MNVSILKNKKSMYTKLLLSFTFTITILIIMLSSFLYYSYAKSSIEKHNDFNTKILSQISYSSTYMNNLATDFCETTFISNHVIPLLYSNTEDYYFIGNGVKSLDTQTIPNTYIHSVYTYNQNLDLYISTKTNGFYNTLDFYDKDMIQIVEQVKDNGLKLIPIARKIPTISNPNEFENVYTYLIYTLNHSKINGAIALNIHADWLRDTIASLNSQSQDENNNIFIIDENGLIVNHSSSDMFLENISDKKYIQKIINSKKNNDYFIERIDNKRYIITYVSSDLLNWKFVNLTPYSSVVSTLTPIKITTIIFCSLILLLGLFFSILMSKIIYFPIDVLINNVEEKMNSDKKVENSNNEILFLNNAFNQILSKKIDLERKNRHTIKIQKNKVLKDIITGNYQSSSYSNEQFKELGVQIHVHTNIFLLLLKIDNYKHFVKQYSDDDRALYKFAIINIINETIPGQYSFETVDMESDHICILLNLDHSHTVKDKPYASMELLASKIQDNVSYYLKLSLSATLGYCAKEYGTLSTTYNDTMLLSMYRIIYGHSSIITPSVLDEINKNEFKFPTSKEKQLLNALKLGNLKKTKDIYYKLISSISSYSYNTIMVSIIYLIFSIYNNISNDIELKSINLATVFNDFFSHMSTFETVEEINELFINLFEEIICKLKESNNSRTETLIKDVICIINEKYGDKNLCLNTIADSFGLTSVYLGKLFKDTTGKSISEFIMDVRMEKVKYLLDTTQLTTKEILDQSGFEQSNYFYTLFKKHFGVTLNNYRLNVHHNNLHNKMG